VSDADVRNALDPKLVEDTAYGLSALESPLWRKPVATWIAMDERQRELYRAKARFVLIYARDGVPATEESLRG
jgi:hypothetical protein